MRVYSKTRSLVHSQIGNPSPVINPEFRVYANNIRQYMCDVLYFKGTGKISLFYLDLILYVTYKCICSKSES